MKKTYLAAFIAAGCAAMLFLALGAPRADAPSQKMTLASGKAIQWPPQVGQPYPDLELLDRNGKTVKLSDFKGKVIVIEPVGMNCPACNAFSGGAKRGGFKGNAVQGGTGSIEEYFPEYTGGLSLHDDGVVFVVLLLFSLEMKGTTPEDAALWADHFGLDGKNTYVLAAGPAFLEQPHYQASYDLIPGLQLVDKKFILRSDATGHHPRDSMWNTLLPMVPALLKE